MGLPGNGSRTFCRRTLIGPIPVRITRSGTVPNHALATIGKTLGGKLRDKAVGFRFQSRHQHAARPIVGDLVPLRANKSETSDCLKFTLEGSGERSDGNARTSAHALACRAVGSRVFDPGV